MRVVQKEGTRGSLKWAQRLVNEHSQLLEDAIRAEGVLQPDETITWVSPLKTDDWAEYRDAAFLEQIGHPELADSLREFWPRGGPQWDALGRGSAGTVVLVEAKAHADELRSSCQAAEDSRAIITRGLDRTKEGLGVSADRDWLEGNYQYANRLAHLRFLQSHGVPATLVFVYFTNADMNGPTSHDEWKTCLTPVHERLGLDGVGSVPGMVSVFIDARQLS